MQQHYWVTTTGGMRYLLLGLSAILLLLGGCAATPHRDYLPVDPQVMESVPQVNGAIYQANSSQPLFEDVRANRIGDTLTVILSESTNASKQNTTSTSKENEIGISNPTLLGSPVQFNTRSNFALQSTSNNTLEMGLNSEQAFDGSGSSTQSNQLTGSVTVTVAKVLPNGNLVVRGEKLLTLDNGSEYVRIKGIVRPSDISANNSISSTKVAHAQITYGGTGVIADAGRHGWMSRLILKFWPF